MCRIASLFLLQGLNGSMLGDARDLKNASCHQVFFSARHDAEEN